MLTISLALIAGLAAVPSAAASLIDQNTLYSKAADSTWLTSGFGRSVWISQSFTPAMTGRLNRIDLQIGRFGGDDLRIRIGSGEAIDGSYVELLSLDVAAADVASGFDQLFSLDLLAHGLTLASGDRYSVILSSTLGGMGNQFGWVIGETTVDGDELANPPYAGGRAFASLDQGGTWQARSVDRPLRTWMTPAVPEPSTWVMLIAGFGLTGFAVRRRSAIA
jgi:hypothetical protein